MSQNLISQFCEITERENEFAKRHESHKKVDVLELQWIESKRLSRVKKVCVQIEEGKSISPKAQHESFAAKQSRWQLYPRKYWILRSFLSWMIENKFDLNRNFMLLLYGAPEKIDFVSVWHIKSIGKDGRQNTLNASKRKSEFAIADRGMMSECLLDLLPLLPNPNNFLALEYFKTIQRKVLKDVLPREAKIEFPKLVVKHFSETQRKISRLKLLFCDWHDKKFHSAQDWRGSDGI